jgi:glucosamine--fructose-6-phosphate aminotransferase (isomerizing)
VIHNGIIENYNTLKKKLEIEGHKFRTETDTETLAHLIEEMSKHTKDLFNESICLPQQILLKIY